VTLEGTNNRVELSNLPPGPVGTVERRLYRSLDGGPAALVRTLDNAVTSVTDNLNNHQLFTTTIPPGTVSDLKAVRDRRRAGCDSVCGACWGRSRRDFFGGAVFIEARRRSTWQRISDTMTDLPPSAGEWETYGFAIGQLIPPTVAGRPAQRNQWGRLAQAAASEREPTAM